jgi:hypothetical protein
VHLFIGTNSCSKARLLGFPTIVNGDSERVEERSWVCRVAEQDDTKIQKNETFLTVSDVDRSRWKRAWVVV